MSLSPSSIIWYCSKRGDLCGWEGLVSQRPCIIDNSGICSYGLKARERYASTPSNAPWCTVNIFLKFQNDLGKPTSECQTILGFTAARDDRRNSETRENYLQLATVRLPRPAYQHRVFTGWMIFLPPNQVSEHCKVTAQRYRIQSLVGTSRNICVCYGCKNPGKL